MTQYKHKLVDFFKRMVRKIFFYLNGKESIDIFGTLADQSQQTDFEYPESIAKNIPKLREFQAQVDQDIRQYEKNLDSFFEGDLPEYYFEYREIQSIYSEKIHPIFKGKLFPFLSILFQKVKMADTRKNLKKVLSSLYLQYKFSVFERDNTVQIRQYRMDVISEYCFKLLKMYRKVRHDFTSLNKFLTKIWVGISRKLLQRLQKIPGLDAKIISQGIKYYTRKFSDLFLDATPLEVSVYDLFRDKLVKYLDSFQRSDIYQNEFSRFKDTDLLDRFISVSGLLGGKSYRDSTRSIVFNLFRLTRGTTTKVSGKGLLL